MSAVVSEAVLLSILSSSASTELGKKWNFASIKSLVEFRQNVPLTDYETYRPYIQRMIEHGEKDLIASGPATWYSPTSGTTSKSKLIPKFTPIVSQKINHVIPPAGRPAGQYVFFANMYPTNMTVLGVPIIAGSAKACQSMLSEDPYTNPFPPEAYSIVNLADALYVQLVFALTTDRSKITVITSFFIITLLALFNILTTDWRQMIADIKEGKLKASLSLTSEQRESIELAMGGPNPTMAAELQVLLESASTSNFKEVVAVLWPNVDLVAVLCGGEYSHYIARLQLYLGKSTSLYSYAYFATESILGVNMWPTEYISAYALLPEVNLYEFIPLDQADSPNPTVLLADEVTTGEKYEIVITNKHGLYRYRVGDIITVIKVSSEGPIIDIVGRKKMAIGLGGPRLYQFQLDEAVQSFTKGKDPSVVTEYLVSSDVSNAPARCVVWLECEGGGVSVDEAAVAIEEHLCRVNQFYKNKDINGKAIVKLLKPGTIADLKRKLAQRSPVGEIQAKLPRVVRDMEHLEMLERSTL